MERNRSLVEKAVEVTFYAAFAFVGIVGIGIAECMVFMYGYMTLSHDFKPVPGLRLYVSLAVFLGVQLGILVLVDVMRKRSRRRNG